MKAVKRVEIVIDAVHAPRVTALIERHGVRGWTLLRGAEGSGERGPRRADDLSGATENAVVLTACPPADLDALVAELRPLLRSLGGICLVSDAAWVVH